MAAEANERPFILKWRSAVWNSSLPASAKFCCICLSEFADLDGSNCYPSLTTIANVTALNEKTVRRNLTLAVDSGFIKRNALGSAQGWRRYEYKPQLPESADTTPARSRKGTDTTPARSRKGTGTTPARSDGTCGHYVQKARALRPKGAGVIPTDLSITYPIPIETKKRPQAALSSVVQLPEWIVPECWRGFVEARSRYPLTPHAAKLMLAALEELRDSGEDPNACLDQSARNGWRDVFPVKRDGLRISGKRPGESLVSRVARINAEHDRRELEQV